MEALFSGPDLGHTERWIAQAARAAILCSARKAEEAAQEPLRIQQEMADQRKPVWSLVLVDALGVRPDHAVQERADIRLCRKKPFAHTGPEGVALGILPRGDIDRRSASAAGRVASSTRRT